MQAMLELEATVGSKGQITLPAAMPARLGLVKGSKVKFSAMTKRPRSSLSCLSVTIAVFCGIWATSIPICPKSRIGFDECI